jgi:hypothetical protein
MADQTRLLELALKGLEAERTRLEEEIAEIRQRLVGGGARLVVAAAAAAGATGRGRGRRGGLSAEGRRKISEMMKARWAARRKAGGAAATPAAKPAKAARKNRLSPAGRRAISEAMKRRWADRRKTKK